MKPRWSVGAVGLASLLAGFLGIGAVAQESSEAPTPAPDGFDSGLLKKDERWSHTFEGAGTYAYFCRPHPYMHGTIRVTSDAAAANGTLVVRIKDFKYQPDDVSIPLGTTVEWVNEDAAAHTVTEEHAGSNESDRSWVVLGILGALGLIALIVFAVNRYRRRPPSP